MNYVNVVVFVIPALLGLLSTALLGPRYGMLVGAALTLIDVLGFVPIIPTQHVFEFELGYGIAVGRIWLVTPFGIRQPLLYRQETRARCQIAIEDVRLEKDDGPPLAIEPLTACFNV